MDIVKIEKPETANVIIGQSHFIKTVEDLYAAMVASVPQVKFGLAFCEASGARRVRCEGTDAALIRVAADNAMRVGCGHTFFVVMEGAYPINVLTAIKNLPVVCHVFCATANPVEVVVATSELGRGVIGVIDGQPPLGIEEESDVRWRKDFLRQIGYKR